MSSTAGFVGAPGRTSTSAAPMLAGSPQELAGAATQRRSRSPQAPRCAGALRLMMRTTKSVARTRGRSTTARTIASLSDAA